MQTQIQPTEIDRLKSQVVCPVELALRVLGGKWRGSILYQLQYGPLRFNELRDRVQDGVVEALNADNFLSNKVLADHLQRLTCLGMVIKTDAEGLAYYQLSEKGESVMPILLDLFDWGETHF